MKKWWKRQKPEHVKEPKVTITKSEPVDISPQPETKELMLLGCFSCGETYQGEKHEIRAEDLCGTCEEKKRGIR